MWPVFRRHPVMTTIVGMEPESLHLWKAKDGDPGAFTAPRPPLRPAASVASADSHIDADRTIIGRTRSEVET